MASGASVAPSVIQPKQEHISHRDVGRLKLNNVSSGQGPLPCPEKTLIHQPHRQWGMLPLLKRRVLDRGPGRTQAAATCQSGGRREPQARPPQTLLSGFFLSGENRVTASCLLQRDLLCVNHRVLDLFSAGERRSISQPSYKLSARFPSKRKRRFT